MKMKKTAALLIAAMLTVCMSVSCKGKNSSSETAAPSAASAASSDANDENTSGTAGSEDEEYLEEMKAVFVGKWENCKEGNDTKSIVCFRDDDTGYVDVEGNVAEFKWECLGAAVSVTYPDGFNEKCILKDGLLCSANGIDLFEFKKVE